MRADPMAADALRRVLVRCPNWLGDTVMALPTLRALRAAAPQAELWALGPWVEPLLATEPGITRRLTVPRAWAARLAQVRALRPARFDLALVLPNSFETALAARLVGARWRIGYAGDGRAWLLTHPLRAEAAAVHQVRAYLGLLAPLGVASGAPGHLATPSPPRLSVDPDRRTEARRLLASIGLQVSDHLVGIQLGAAFGPSKLWPAERLAALAARLEGDGSTVVFLGSAAAEPLLAAVGRHLPAPPRSLVGRDHPGLLPALLAELAVLVTPDSGPAHVGAAVGVPVVAVFGPTDPRLTAPLGDAVRVICRPPSCAPCFLSTCPIDHRCLTGVTVDEVRAAVAAHLVAAR